MKNYKKFFAQINMPNRKHKFTCDHFFQQLSILLSAQIPLTHCFTILIDNRVNTSQDDMLNNIKYMLFSGKSLTQALQAFPKFFNAFICQMISVGEKSGKLDTIITYLAKILAKQTLQKQQLQQLLFYPCLVFSISFCTSIIMLFFVLPNFAQLFSPSQLPAITANLLKLTSLLQTYALEITFMLTLLIVSIYYQLKMLPPCVKYHLLLKLPYVKGVILNAAYTRFCFQLGLCLTAGIPLASALNILAEKEPIPILQNILQMALSQIQTGIPLHQALSQHRLIPLQLVQMIRLGEESGKLDLLLLKAAAIYEEMYEATLKYFIKLLEPLIMLIQGVLIGTVVIGMYVPIFKLGNLF